MPNDTAKTTTDATGSDDDNVDPRVERTRAAVVAAAGELLLAEGPDAITHARVAAAADVSRTTVYKHWPERADLLRSTLTGIGKSAPLAEFTGDTRHDLRLMIEQLAGDLNDPVHRRLILTMLARAQHDPIVGTVRESVFAEFHDAFHAVVADGARRGELRAEIDTERALAMLGGPLMFLRLLADRPIDDGFIDAVVDAFVAAHAP